MKPSRTQSRRQRSVRIAFAVTAVSAVALVALFGDADRLFTTGSMSMTGSALSTESTSYGWSRADAPGALDDELRFGWRAVNTSPVNQAGHYRIFASRDEVFGEANDCLVTSRNVELAPGESVDVAATLRARSVPCLDAGSWTLFMVGETGQAVQLDGQLDILNGDAEFALASASSHVAHRGSVDVTVNVYRPASEDGFDGLHDYPVDVWMAKDDVVCVVRTDGVTVPRDPVQARQSWTQDEWAVSVPVRSAVRVVDYDPFRGQGAIESASRVEQAGKCPVEEGAWTILVGPADRTFAETETIFVHAAPVVVDPTPVELTLPSGEVTEFERAMYNPSQNDVTWSAVASTTNSKKWLIATADQTLPGRGRETVALTVSAFGLAPGVYSADFVVKADDFYGTEVTIPVVLKVLSAKSRIAGSVDSVDELPRTFSASNFPNPFRSTTTIRLQVDEPGAVTVAVYDVSGREIATVFDAPLQPGTHDVEFDGSALPSGTYLYRVQTPGGGLSGTMTLIK